MVEISNTYFPSKESYKSQILRNPLYRQGLIFVPDYQGPLPSKERLINFPMLKAYHVLFFLPTPNTDL